jgi:hypothetical protein
MVAPSYVEKRLGISRPTRLILEAKGILNPVRLADGAHRRYSRAEVDALAESHTSSDPSPLGSDETAGDVPEGSTPESAVPPAAPSGAIALADDAA